MTATVGRNDLFLSTPHGGTLPPDRPTAFDAVETVLTAVTGAMGAHGYQEADISAVRLALWEAILNAVKHGHGRAPEQNVSAVWDLEDDIGFAMRLMWPNSWASLRVWWEVADAGVVVRVVDGGDGFDPRNVPDPTDPAHLEELGGRGLLLMQRSMTRLAFSPRGNSVTLWKCRTE